MALGSLLMLQKNPGPLWLWWPTETAELWSSHYPPFQIPHEGDELSQPKPHSEPCLQKRLWNVEFSVSASGLQGSTAERGWVDTERQRKRTPTVHLCVPWPYTLLFLHINFQTKVAATTDFHPLQCNYSFIQMKTYIAHDKKFKLLLVTESFSMWCSFSF